MKKLLMFLVIIIGATLFGCSSEPKVDTEHPYVIIDVEDFGKMIVELYPDVAPISVDNFLKYASEGFYDGLIFHRIIKDFMIQGGASQSTECPIEGEFLENNIENELLHTRGVISMARTTDLNSATSQFFIMHQDEPFLDGKYAAFGKLIQGFDVLDAIAEVAVNPQNAFPLSEVVIKSISVHLNGYTLGERVCYVAQGEIDTYLSQHEEAFSKELDNVTLEDADVIKEAIKDYQTLSMVAQDNLKEEFTFLLDLLDQVNELQFIQLLNDIETEYPYIIMKIRGFGVLAVELYPDIAPISVDNFLHYASEGFYDNLTFHRIIKGFMIQGGASQSTECAIMGEFSENGIENDLLHTRGVISMARTTNPNSATSQFFIMHQDSPHLDGKYAAFGKLIYGFDVLDTLADVRVNPNFNHQPFNEPVITQLQAFLNGYTLSPRQCYND